MANYPVPIGPFTGYEKSARGYNVPYFGSGSDRRYYLPSNMGGGGLRADYGAYSIDPSVWESGSPYTPTGANLPSEYRQPGRLFSTNPLTEQTPWQPVAGGGDSFWKEIAPLAAFASIPLGVGLATGAFGAGAAAAGGAADPALIADYSFADLAGTGAAAGGAGAAGAGAAGLGADPALVGDIALETGPAGGLNFSGMGADWAALESALNATGAGSAAGALAPTGANLAADFGAPAVAGASPGFSAAGGGGTAFGAPSYASGWAPSAGDFGVGAAEATGAGAGGGSVGDMLASISGKDLLKWGMPALGLGASLMFGQKQIPEQGNLQAQQSQYQAGASLTQNAIAGKLTPANQAAIERWRAQQMASAKQYLINSGQGVDSTSYLQLQANIDQQALAISQGFLDQMFSQGMQLMGVGDAATQQLVQLRLQQQAQTSQALSTFMNTYALMMAWGQRA